MKKFLTKIIYFLLPILFLGISMELLLREIPNNHLVKKELLDKNAPEIETLILGSSHSLYDLNPLYFTDKTFNAGHIAQSLKYDYKILAKYQSNLTKLKTIILPISYFTLYHNLDEDKDAWLRKNYLVYYKMTQSKSIFDYSEIFSSQLKVNKNRLTSYYIKGESEVFCTDTGWGTNYNSKDARNLKKTGRSAAKRHTHDINSEKYQQIYKDNLIALNSIVTWCNNRNVKILMVTLPAYETYRQNLNQLQLDKTIKTVNEVCLKYKNCSYLNLLQDENFIASDYYDADHLSEIGAEKISLLINKVIEEQ